MQLPNVSASGLAHRYDAFANFNEARLLVQMRLDAENPANKKLTPLLTQFDERTKEYGELVQEVQKEYGREAALFLKHEMSALIRKHFGEETARNRPDMAISNFMKESLYTHIASSARNEKRGGDTGRDTARRILNEKGEDLVEPVLFRVLDYQLHWDNKQPVAPLTTINERMKEIERVKSGSLSEGITS